MPLKLSKLNKVNIVLLTNKNLFLIEHNVKELLCEFILTSKMNCDQLSISTHFEWC